ncbi:MAG: hypothetical protein M3Y37_03765, partial [Chloroflexota bacterium]|nr:hypothetical protein [Chloroflexota bacterium]
MEAQTYAQDFFDYITSHEAQPPTYRFVARAVIRPDVPHLFSLVPRGEMVIWPDFMAFLSDARSGQHDTHSNFKDLPSWMFSWDLPSLAVGIAADLIRHGTEKPDSLRDLLEGSLRSPATFFIPLDKLSAVETGHRFSQGDWIRLTVDDTDIFVCEVRPWDVGGYLRSRVPSSTERGSIVRQLRARVRANNRAGVIAVPADGSG